MLRWNVIWKLNFFLIILLKSLENHLFNALKLKVAQYFSQTIFSMKDLLQIYAWTGQPDNLYSQFSPLSLPPGSRVMFESIFHICYRRDRDWLCRDRMAEGHVFEGRMAVSAAAGYVGADWYINIALIFPFLPLHHIIFMQQQCFKESRVWSYRGQDAIKNVAFPHYSQRDLIIKVNATLGRRFV